MPGILHQGVLSLFKEDPWLAFDLLGRGRPVDGTPVDRATELDVAAPQPWKVNPIYPDVVLVWRDPDKPQRGIVIGVEAQCEPDPNKRWQILAYIGLLALLHHLDVHIVVVSYSRAYSRMVRSWSRRWPKIEALILDASLPTMTLEQARARPTAAVLVATLHGARGDIAMARIAIAAIQDLPEQRRQAYTTTILAALSKRQRIVLIEELPVKQREEQLWAIEKRSGTYLLGRDEGRKEGRQEGREEGREEVRHVLTELILTVLQVRGVSVTPKNAARIRAEKDMPTLERWAAAAREVGRVSQLFALG